MAKINKKAQAPLKQVAYIGGGAILAYLIFNSLESAIIGGLIGLLISFKW